MNVNLPQLCEDPYFLSPEILLTPRKIKCHPILSEQDYLEWHKGNKIPLPSPPPKLQMPKRENKYMLLQNDKPSSQLQTPLKNIAIKIMKELSELNLENDKGKGNSPPRFLIVDGEDFPLVENTAPSSRDKSKEKNEMDPSENEHEEISFKVVTYENNNEEMKEFENVEEEKQEKQDKDSKERVEL
ncbi:hypothetical protein HMI56_006968 [Coelomomyces lativittatus]|nr:hypothetical protein HMI56_006968 [Coelomomyces lativittatus]